LFFFVLDRKNTEKGEDTKNFGDEVFQFFSTTFLYFASFAVSSQQKHDYSLTI